MTKTAKATRKGKRKGQTALFFPKWHYTTNRNQKAVKRKIRAIGRGI